MNSFHQKLMIDIYIVQHNDHYSYLVANIDENDM